MKKFLRISCLVGAGIAFCSCYSPEQRAYYGPKMTYPKPSVLGYRDSFKSAKEAYAAGYSQGFADSQSQAVPDSEGATNGQLLAYRRNFRSGYWAGYNRDQQPAPIYNENLEAVK